MTSARLQRWALTLSAYQFDIVHRKGDLNSNADALSRLPLLDQPKDVPLPGEIVHLMNYLDMAPQSQQFKLRIGPAKIRTSPK